jgi:tripartite-type tricarboxylate transporter receptor subunit TctC
MAHIKSSVCALTVIGASFAFPAGADAQNYPVRPIRFVVTGSPGSSGDALGRLVAEGLSQRLGQQVILDNRPGAGANIGPEIVAKSAADGYTVFMVTISHAVNATLYPKLAYNIISDFAPVTQLVTDPAVLVVNSAVPVKSVTELIALAKSKPGGLNYSSGGTGTFTFLAAELFKGQTGVNIVHVPYKGGGPALLAVVAGEVSVYFAPLGVALPFIKQGRLRALAVTTEKRVPMVSELPTVADSGVPGFQSGNWFGLLVPAKTPKTTVTRLHSDTLAWLNEAGTVKTLDSLAYVRIGSTPEAFAAFIKSEVGRMGKIVTALHLTPD